MDFIGSIINAETNEVIVSGVKFFIVEIPSDKFTIGEWSGYFIALGEFFEDDRPLKILLNDGRVGKILVSGRDDNMSFHTFQGTGALE